MTRAQLFIRYWLPALAWTTILLSLGGNSASGGNTENLIESLLTPLFGTLQYGTLELLNYAARKSSHIAGYALLGLLNFRAIRGDRAGWTLFWSFQAVALALAVAIADEYRQSFAGSRTGSAYDVGFDLWGAVVSQFFARGRRS